MKGVCIIFSMELNGKEEEVYKVKLDADKADFKVGLKVAKCNPWLD